MTEGSYVEESFDRDTTYIEDRITAHAPTERVGEIAAAHGVVLHELTAERASLEEVFLELTGEPGERGG